MYYSPNKMGSSDGLKAFDLMDVGTEVPCDYNTII
jgi:hypothetical protein